MYYTSTNNPSAWIVNSTDRGRKKIYLNSKVYLENNQEFQLEFFNPLQDSVLAEIKTALTPIASTIKTDAKAIGSSALSYIETNGLQDAYQIALTVVGGAVAGTPWGSTLAAVTAAVVADGSLRPTLTTGRGDSRPGRALLALP